MVAERTKARLKRYPQDWKAIVAEVRKRSENTCECRGECGLHHDLSPAWNDMRCSAPNGEYISRKPEDLAQFVVASVENVMRFPDWREPVKVILTTAHVCPPEFGHDEGCRNLAHLLHACQLCHLRIDRFLHARHAAETRQAKKRAGTLEMFPTTGGAA